MAKANKIRIKLKAFDHKLLDASAAKIVAAAKGIYSFVEFLIYCNKFPAYALFPYVMF